MVDQNTIKARTIKVPHLNNNVYIHIDDVINILTEFGATEETDVQNRMNKLATNIEQLKK